MATRSSLAMEMSASGEGAIHVFTRNAQHNWSRQAFIKAAVPVAFTGFGINVATSHDGNRTLVADVEKIYVLEREAGQWRQAHIIESEPGIFFFAGTAIAMSSDGSSIAVRVFPVEQDSGGVHVYKLRADGWQLAAELPSAKTGYSSQRLAIISAGRCRLAATATRLLWGRQTTPVTPATTARRSTSDRLRRAPCTSLRPMAVARGSGALS